MKNSKVVWSEGLFLTPHHFQKEEVYLENFAKQLVFQSNNEDTYGISEIDFDYSLLDLGKFGVKMACGVFADGTPFHIDQELVIDIPEGTTRQTVYLAIPVYREGNLQVQYGENVKTRYRAFDSDIYDVTDINGEQIKVQLADLNVSLKLGNEKLDNYLTIPIAEISEYVLGGRVVINKAFIPQCTSIRVSDYIRENIKYIYDKLQYRSTQVARRLGAGGNSKSYQSMIRDFMWMSGLGEWTPVWKELAQNTSLRTSPKTLYFYCISMIGKMYGLEGKVAPELEMWNFNNLYGVFSQIFGLIHESLRDIQSDNVTTLKWDTSLYASRHLLRAMVRDRALYVDSMFVLVVSSPAGPAVISQEFPKVCKIASNSDIANIVLNALSGVPIRSLPVAPSELKTRANAAYFEIDTKSEIWQNIVNNDEPIALHVDDRFTDIEIELNIIKA